jgi:hypothetical protein
VARRADASLRSLTTGSLVVACLCLAAATASAQTDRFAILGGSVAHYHPMDDDAHDSTGFAFVYRFGRPNGFRPTVGFNWFTTRFDGHVGPNVVELGRLRLRPVMGGYGYTIRRGRWALTGSAVAGIAFNTFHESDEARVAYSRIADRVLLDVSASNSPVARGEVALWYDVNSRIGLVGIVGYIAARPELDIVTDAGKESRRVKADAMKVQIGMAYGFF